MAYGIRKINENGIHYNFQWPMEVGAVATAPDWRPDNECGGGLHFCKPSDEFCYMEFVGDLWAVIEYDEAKAIDLCGKYKVETCKLVYLSESSEGILDFFKDSKFNSEMAYEWAMNFGNREYMRQFVTEPEWAHYWARGIGDTEHMRAICKGTEYEF